jgi:hypothetical protein
VPVKGVQYRLLTFGAGTIRTVAQVSLQDHRFAEGRRFVLDTLRDVVLDLGDRVKIHGAQSYAFALSATSRFARDLGRITQISVTAELRHSLCRPRHRNELDLRCCKRERGYR